MSFGRRWRLMASVVVGICGSLAVGCGEDFDPIQPCLDGTRRDCTTSTGSLGEQSCTQGMWGSCTPKVVPCADGARKDCTMIDGEAGEQICSAGVWGACSYKTIPGTCEEGTFKKCTTKDNLEGVRECVEGVWSECTPVVQPDCENGEKQACTTDCGVGTEICVNSTWENCDAPKPETEVCDGIDNNCDGTIDEQCLCVHGKTEACYSGPDPTRMKGQCKDGQKVCTTGLWGECVGEVLPAAEENCSDIIDNDCNDQINDGCICTPGEKQVCGSNVGECSQGEQLCNVDAEYDPCLGAIGPVAENTAGCDGKDNNCDGLIDNGLDSDGAENNDQCLYARPYTVIDTDPTYTEKTLTIYPEGDVDYFRITADEQAIINIYPNGPCCPWPFCTPADAQCNFLDVELVNPIQVGLQYQFSVLTDDCASPAQTFTDTSAMTVRWEGACGADDSNNFWIKVEAATSSVPTFSCKPYTLKFRYRLEEEHCCTFVSCSGTSDPICASQGCGVCSNGMCSAPSS